MSESVQSCFERSIHLSSWQTSREQPLKIVRGKKIHISLALFRLFFLQFVADYRSFNTGSDTLFCRGGLVNTVTGFYSNFQTFRRDHAPRHP